MWTSGAHPSAMAKKPKIERDVFDAEDDDDRLYLGEWFSVLGFKAAKVARESGINEGYLSQLIGRKKTNPTRSTLKKIGKVVGVEWHLFYELPPPRSAIEHLHKYGPSLLERLGRGKR